MTEYVQQETIAKTMGHNLAPNSALFSKETSKLDPLKNEDA